MLVFVGVLDISRYFFVGINVRLAMTSRLPFSISHQEVQD